MKVSVNWMRDYATLDAPVEGLVRALVDSGTEVGEVSDEGSGLAVARVVALTPVLGARNLLFVDIDVGLVPPASLVRTGFTGGTIRLLTGAQNLKVGDLVPYAPPGTRPPALDEPVGVKVIRGQRSPGMLCSAAELDAGDDASGILKLESGVPGQPLREVLDLDTVLDVEVTTNRPDCLCHVGIARELAAVLGEPLNEPEATVAPERESATRAELRARLRVEDPQGCLRFSLAVIEGVTAGEAPEWMRRRLRAIGLRPINAVVDTTNYVAHELGQPLHAFDLDKFIAAGAAGVGDVVVRRARAGETLVCLDGVERTLAGEDIVVAAGSQAASLAGIIGGAATAVDAGTRSVLLEAATWDGPTIRATSRRLGVRTDASSLFEKGLSDVLPPQALGRAASLIAENCGGHVLRGVIEQRLRPQPEPAPITVTADFLSGLLGCPVDASAAATALAHLGFAVQQDGALLIVVPPPFRLDVRIPEDVVEEVGRMLGYARVPSTLPGRRQTAWAPASPASIEEEVRDVCLGAGFHEAITLSFTSPRAAAVIPGLGDGKRTLRLRNPLSEEWSVLRASQLPGLAAALAGNVRRGVEEAALFELGRVYWDGERAAPAPGSTPDGADVGLPPLPLEPLLLTVAMHRSRADGQASAEDLRHVQALFAWLAGDLAGVTLAFEPARRQGLRSGRTAAISVDGAAVGLVGELAPAAIAALDVEGRVVAGELRLDGVFPPVRRTPHFLTPAQYPAVDRDLAVTVDISRSAAEALGVIEEAARPLLESVRLYDEYRGERVPGGRKGWTFRLSFRSETRTLTAEEADRALEAAVAALRSRLGAEPRR
jgi:phenylalanyl-tRNA synthetase beta chain